MLNEFSNPVFVWCLAGIILFVIEFIVPGFVVFFFGLGALIVGLLCYLIPALSVNSQLIIFVISSIATLVLLRKWFKSIFSGIFSKKRYYAEKY